MFSAECLIGACGTASIDSCQHFNQAGDFMTSESVATSRKPRLLRHYIDGEFVASAAMFPNLSPVDGTEIAQVCEADAATVDLAVRAACAAQRGGWRDTTPT